MTLPYGSNSSITISKYAIEGLKKIYKKNIEYKKAGSDSNGTSSK